MVNEDEFSHLPQYRRYYERLSLAFQDIVGKRRRSPTLEYYGGFKYDVLFPLVLDRVQNAARVLDVGCGSGSDLLALSAGRPFQGIGLDFTWNNLSLANQQTRSVGAPHHWVQSPMERMPFQDGVFDHILCSEAIEHVVHPESVLSEIKRVLKPGGFLYLTTPNRYSYFSLISDNMPVRLKSALRRWVWNMPRDYGESPHYLDDPGVKRHVHEFGLGELKALLRRNGFRVVSAHGSGFAVPIPALFDRWPILLGAWKVFDRLVSLIPGSIYLKDSLVVVTKATTPL